MRWLRVTPFAVGLLVAWASRGAADVCAYVANSGAGSVSVIDTATSTVRATIAVGDTPRAVALTPDATRAGDLSHDGDVAVNEIQSAVRAALDGCPASESGR